MPDANQVYTPPGPALRWVMRLLALAALAVSSVLLWVSTAEGAQLPGCGGGSSISGCDSALASMWARWFTLPVSALAIINYVCILVALFLIGPAQPATRQRMAWAGLLACTFAAAGAAVWFIAIMFLKLDSVCAYCLTAHACGVVLAAMVWLRAPIRLQPPLQPVHLGPTSAAVLVIVGFLAVAALAAGQTLGPSGPTHWVEKVAPPESNQTPPTSPAPQAVAPTPAANPSVVPVVASADPSLFDAKREIFVLGGQVRLRPHEGPIIGSPAAPHIVLSFFDYTCSHCRKMHKHFSAVRRRYGEQLGILALPIPLDRTCNRNVPRTHESHKHACALATLALRVWKTDSSKFETFDSWLFEGKRPPTPDVARDYAVELLGAAKFRKTKYHRWPRRRIDANLAIQKVLQRKSLPVLIVGDRIVWGPPKKIEDLFEVFEESLKIKPVEGMDEVGEPG